MRNSFTPTPSLTASLPLEQWLPRTHPWLHPGRRASGLVSGWDPGVSVMGPMTRWDLVEGAEQSPKLAQVLPKSRL